MYSASGGEPHSGVQNGIEEGLPMGIVVEGGGLKILSNTFIFGQKHLISLLSTRNKKPLGIRTYFLYILEMDSNALQAWKSPHAQPACVVASPEGTLFFRFALVVCVTHTD